jgi:hypothetical protein
VSTIEHCPKKLLDHVREAIRRKRDSIRTAEASVTWIKRYSLLHNKRHPNEKARAELEAFLTHLAVQQQVAASTPHQALSAWPVLFHDVRNTPLDPCIAATRANKPTLWLMVVAKEEPLAGIERLAGTPRGTAKQR